MCDGKRFYPHREKELSEIAAIFSRLYDSEICSFKKLS